MRFLWVVAVCFVIFLHPASALSGASPATYTLLGNINELRARVSGAVDEIPSRISGIPSPRDRIPDVFVGSTTAPFSIAADECVDNKPHPLFNCRHHKKFRKCRSSIMIRGDFCARTCGRCEEKKIVSPNPVTVEIAVCDDVPPDDQFSCADQYRFGKCDERFILDGNYCAHTCRRYPCVEEVDPKAIVSRRVTVPKLTGAQRNRPSLTQIGGVKITPISPSNTIKSEDCSTPKEGIVGSTLLQFFGEALEATGLTPILDDPYAALTIFAPTNDAFEELANSIQRTKYDLLAAGFRGALKEILKVHIVTSGVYTSTTLSNNVHVKTMNTQTLSFKTEGTHLSVSTSFSTPALVLHQDVGACNSVVHVIGKVLLPDISKLMILTPA